MVLPVTVRGPINSFTINSAATINGFLGAGGVTPPEPLPDNPLGPVLYVPDFPYCFYVPSSDGTTTPFRSS